MLLWNRLERSYWERLKGVGAHLNYQLFETVSESRVGWANPAHAASR